ENIVSIPLMAQAVMSIVLRRPDSARARPSSLLKDDSDYDRLFDPGNPIELYRLCVVVLRRIEFFARTSLVAKHRNNIKFYAALHLACMACRKQEPTVRDLCQIQLDTLPSLAKASLDAVWAAYSDLGGSDQVAKGPALLQRTLKDLKIRLR